MEPQVLLAHHNYDSRDNQSIGQLIEKSTVYSTEWSMRLCDRMVGIQKINRMRVDKD